MSLPTMPTDTRAAFARLAHSHAHEVLALRALLTRCRTEGITTMEGVAEVANGMIAERAQRIAATPDAVCDTYESASATQAMDLALVQGAHGHA